MRIPDDGAPAPAKVTRNRRGRFSPVLHEVARSVRHLRYKPNDSTSFLPGFPPVLLKKGQRPIYRDNIRQHPGDSRLGSETRLQGQHPTASRRFKAGGQRPVYRQHPAMPRRFKPEEKPPLKKNEQLNKASPSPSAFFIRKRSAPAGPTFCRRQPDRPADFIFRYPV